MTLVNDLYCPFCGNRKIGGEVLIISSAVFITEVCYMICGPPRAVKLEKNENGFYEEVKGERQ